MFILYSGVYKGFPTVAQGTLVGYVNNIQIPRARFTAGMTPLPDGTATHVNVTVTGIPLNLGQLNDT